MDYKYIGQLLDRYFDCDTTASEERMLRAFFSGDDIPAEFARYKALFDTEAQAATDGVSEGFKSRVLQKAGIVPVVEARPRTFSLRLVLRPLYNAVAAIAIVMLVGHLAQVSFSDNNSSGAVTNVTANGQTDTTTIPALENLKAVGNGQKTATLGDSTAIITAEQATKTNTDNK